MRMMTLLMMQPPAKTRIPSDSSGFSSGIFAAVMSFASRRYRALMASISSLWMIHGGLQISVFHDLQ